MDEPRRNNTTKLKEFFDKVETVDDFTEGIELNRAERNVAIGYAIINGLMSAGASYLTVLSHMADKPGTALAGLAASVVAGLVATDAGISARDSQEGIRNIEHYRFLETLNKEELANPPVLYLE